MHEPAWHLPPSYCAFRWPHVDWKELVARAESQPASKSKHHSTPPLSPRPTHGPPHSQPRHGPPALPPHTRTSSMRCWYSLSCLGSGKVMPYTRCSGSRLTSPRQCARDMAVTPTAYQARKGWRGQCKRVRCSTVLSRDVGSSGAHCCSQYGG